MPCNQKGIAHIVLIILAVFGIAIGLYLVQTRTNFLPKAQQEVNLTPQTAFHLLSAVNYHLYDQGQGSTAGGYGLNADTASSNESAVGPGKIAPTRTWFYPGEEIRVNVAVSSDIDPANTFSAVVSYPTDLLEVTNIIKENQYTTFKDPIKDSKINSVLMELIQSNGRESFAKTSGIDFYNGKVSVNLRVDKKDLTAQDLDYQTVGFTETARYETLIDGTIPPDNLVKMAENSHIIYIGAQYSGSTATQDSNQVKGTTIICAQVITKACSPERSNCTDKYCTGVYYPRECKDFPTPCDIPAGWEIEDPNLRRGRSCDQSNSCPSGYYCKPLSTCTEGGACTDVVGGECYPNPSPVPSGSCRPRPSCLDSEPRCLLPETPDMCPPSLKPVEDYFIKYWLPDTKFDNQTGQVILSGGVSGSGIKTIPPNKPIMATIIFKAKKPGEAKLEFGGDSLILRNSDSENILTNKNGLTIQIQDPAKPVIKGDLDGDGVVGYKDFSILLSKWGTDDKKADINSDGKVNIYDFSILLTNWTGRKR